MEKFGSGPMGGTDGYGSHVCGKPYVAGSKVSQKEFEELARLETHQQGYLNHQVSWRREQAHRDDVLSRADKREDIVPSQWTHLIPAFEQLRQNRHSLSYSYVFAYYQPEMAKHVNLEIFRNLQADLARHTEQLSNCLQTKEIDKLIADKEVIVNHTNLAKKVLWNLFDASSTWAAQDTQDPIEVQKYIEEQRKLHEKEARKKAKNEKKNKSKAEAAPINGESTKKPATAVQEAPIATETPKRRRGILGFFFRESK